MGAFGRGELSLDQVAVIVRHAPAWADVEVTELAKMLTVTQLRRSVGRYVFPIVTDPDAPSRCHRRTETATPPKPARGRCLARRSRTITSPLRPRRRPVRVLR